jgi:predicted alpha-1,2-mannosidase
MMTKEKFYNVYLATVCIVIIGALGLFNPAQAAVEVDSPADYVNPFIGTGGEGHTFPGAVVPFGMVQLSPDTNIKHYKKNFNWCAGYRYEDPTILGFSHTHFSGTGHSDMGDILIMPATGKILLDSGSEKNPDSGYRSRYSHEHEQASPGYYSVLLQDDNIKAELTAGKRVGFHKYTFPKSDSAHIIIDLIHSIHNYDGKVIWSQFRVENDRLITGFRQTRGWASTRYIYFAMRFSRPFESHAFSKGDDSTYKFNKNDNLITGLPEIFGSKLKAVLKFKTAEKEAIFIKVGISAVSAEGALKNLDTEIPHWDFEKVRADARKAWEKELDSIIIEGSKKDKEIFYTSVYHLLLAPALYQDVDGKYRGLDLNIHKADGFVNHTIYSLWDTYRATHPLFTIIRPTRVNDMIKSMLAHYQQSAYNMLPIWSFHHNETWCMIGYHAVSVIADAYLKGIRDYDTELAFKAMVDTATRKEYDGLEHYMKLGYVPIDKEEEGASKTLEYAYDDWTIAQMAGAMGKEDVYKKFIKRAGFYKNIFDPKTGFMRAKNSDGSWREPFDPLFSKYGGDYTEGNAWQYSWYVPHDVQGLIKLMGGRNKFVKKLDKLFSIKTTDKNHFLVEDISGLIGQYAHGNEPSQHIAYLYNYAAKPWKTQERIHQVMNNLFDNTPFGICGNEDCGQMSAWFILSSMGFYPVAPGDLAYVIGKPCLPKATIHLENNKSFVMTARNLSDKYIYIQSVILNGKKYNKSYITHNDIISGGTLVFEMGPKPNKRWATLRSSLPPSMN